MSVFPQGKFCISLLLGLALLLSACGFHLRGGYELPFESIFIDQPEYSELGAVLKRGIRANSKTRIVNIAKEAQAVFNVVSDAQAKNILSLNSAGRVREFQLVRNFVFKVTDKAGRELVPQSLIVVTRDISFSDAQVLSKETEEAVLWRDMQSDLVQQVLRRLAAAKLKTGEE